jgi:hypothetical protein
MWTQVLRHVATTRFVLEIPAHKLRLRPQYWLPNATAATAATQSALLILSLSLWVCLYGIVKVAFHRCSSLRLEAKRLTVMLRQRSEETWALA